MGGNTREAGRSTASRVLSLFAAFSSVRPVLGLTELAMASGLPMATAHRLAGELVQWGALERREDGRYQIGLRLWHTGALAPVHRDLRSIALPFMGDLYEATHENVQIGVRDGSQVLCLEKITGRHSVANAARVGGPLPAHATGLGKVILAFADADMLADVIADGLTRYTPHTITLPAVLADTLRQVRENHIAYALEELTIGVSSVAAPIFDATGDMVAALALVARATTNIRALTAAVRTAALGVTRELSQLRLPPGENMS
ncbi:MAG TPA: IclR family transcriptional regulator [Pseudonocardiaceae bacterium]